MKIYLNHTSNAPQRVRIALALKQIAVEEIPIDLERDGGEQHAPAFAAINPQRMLPVLVDGDCVIRQSLAILEYLEEKKPEPALLPSDAGGRARVRSLAQMIACDGQPLLNLRVRIYLNAALRLSPAQSSAWFHHWMRLSLAEYEAALGDGKSGRFSHGDRPTLADVCLVPQVLMARRFDVPTSDYPNIARIFATCMTLAEFRSVDPEHARRSR